MATQSTQLVNTPLLFTMRPLQAESTAPKHDSCLKKFVVGTVTTVATGVFGYMASLVGTEYMKYSETGNLNDVNWRVVSLASIAMGMTARVAANALLTLKEGVETVREFIAWLKRWGLDWYLAFFNLGDNLSAIVPQAVLAFFRQLLVGWFLTGNVWNYFAEKKMLFARSEEEGREEVNPILAPAHYTFKEDESGKKVPHYNFKGQLAQDIMFLGAGSALWLASTYLVKDEAGQKILENSRNFTYMIPVGRRVTQGLWYIFSRLAQLKNNAGLEKYQYGGPELVSKSFVVVRNVAGTVQQMGTKVICVLPLFFPGNQWVSSALGVAYGSYCLNSEKFFTRMTNADWKVYKGITGPNDAALIAQVNQLIRPNESGDDNQSVGSIDIDIPQIQVEGETETVNVEPREAIARKRAKRVDQITKHCFFAVFVSWLIYGVASSEAGDDRINTGILLGSFGTSYFVGLGVLRRFTPGECWRITNELLYRIGFNIFILGAMMNLSLSVIAGINSQSIDSTSGWAEVIGRIAVSCFGILVAFDMATGGDICRKYHLDDYLDMSIFREIIAGFRGDPLVS